MVNLCGCQSRLGPTSWYFFVFKEYNRTIRDLRLLLKVNNKKDGII